MMPAVGAVVVSYNSAALLPGALASLAAQHITTMVVVDNASRDDSAKIAARAGAQVVILPNNKGFAAAGNRGAALLNTPLILFFNPDATFASGDLADTIRYLTDHPRVGAAGLLLCDRQGAPERRSFGKPVRWWSLLSRHVWRPTLPVRPQPFGWVSAGALVVRRNAFAAIKGFDEGFFMYWEDVDLCERLRVAGWQVILDPRVRVTHERGASQVSRHTQTALYDASADRYFRKHYAAMICWFLTRLRRVYRWFSPSAL